ncbi:MAG TPA: DUF542 domain-containing protein [Chloroflexota bacterium]|nr:DUF542 domain-containing protein [Chloroflexota bacterium]
MTQTSSGVGPDWTVNEVTAAYPATLRVFGRHQIDSCCGGLKSLDEVARAHGLLIEGLLAELEDAIALPSITPSERKTGGSP